jgi:hypothetical protein
LIAATPLGAVALTAPTVWSAASVHSEASRSTYQYRRTDQARSFHLTRRVDLEDFVRKLIVSEFVSRDGVMQAPGGEDEDRDGGFAHGGWTRPYWDDAIGQKVFELISRADALLLGRKTYVTHAEAFEPMPAGDPFGDVLNPPKKYVVSRSLEKAIWRNTRIIRDNVIEAVEA